MTRLLAPAPVPELDPALPGLRAALSARPPGVPAGSVCRVRTVEWEPRRRCRIVKESRTDDGDQVLLACEVRPSGTVVRRPADDPVLPGLADALDPAVAAHRLAGVVGAPVGACRVTPVAWRPGSRAVVAYDLTAGEVRSRFYAKVLADGAARYAASAEAIAGAARRRGAEPPVPDIAAVWPDLGAAVSRAAPGRPLSAVLRDPSLPEHARLRHAGQLGRVLADVHATASHGAAVWRAEDELTAVEGLLAAAGHADPSSGRSLAALVDRLADAPPAEDRLVLGHGAFRAGQVLVDGGTLTLLDLDTVGVADAGRDAGNALAYLIWAEVRGEFRAELAAALREAFLAGYARAATAPDARALAWWTAAAMAKIAGRRFRSLAMTEWGAVPQLLDRAAALLHPAGTGGGPSARARGTAVDPLDVAGMTAVLRAAPALPEANRVRVLGARVVAEASGRRQVLRYDVEGLEAGGIVPLVGKIHNSRHRSSMAWENLRVLGSEVFAATPRLAVPAAVCHLRALRMVLYRQVAGTPLDRLPPGEGAALADRVAGWLTTLHTSEAVLTRRLDLAHEVAQVEDWATRVGEEAPDARATADALARALAAAAAALPAAPEVPVHKDFHAGHVLVVEDRHTADGVHGRGDVVVLDLDEARMGDPALDVAHLTTYLDLSPWPGAPAARAAFLAGYGPLPGPEPEARLAFFAAHTHLKIAKQLVAGRGPLAAPPARSGRAGVLAVLRRGLACLGG